MEKQITLARYVRTNNQQRYIKVTASLPLQELPNGKPRVALIRTPEVVRAIIEWDVV